MFLVHAEHCRPVRIAGNRNFQPQRTQRAQRETVFTAENAESAEKKWVPNSDQQGYLSSAISAVNFFILYVLRVRCGEVRLGIWLIADR
jgi:hypothetical protein